MSKTSKGPTSEDSASEDSTSEASSRQPEALVTFAATARSAGKVSPNAGLEVTEETAPMRGDLQAQHDTATKILREGVLGSDEGANEALDALPDRTRSTVKD